LQIVEDEAPIIRLIYDKFVNTTMGIGAIAVVLNQKIAYLGCFQGLILFFDLR